MSSTGTSLAAASMTTPRPTLLRVLACGSVDDGKSTLLARLLLDCGRLRSDELAEVGGADEKLALVLDGLESEREQGITVDVTYRTLETPRRRVRLLDAPGHEQYTRNMATAASAADIAILLVDIGRGILPQTRRHATICALFGIRHVVLAVNKMDAAGYAQERFERIVGAFATIASRHAFDRIEAIPVSGLRGDNVVRRSDAMPWWTGPTLLSCLDGVSLADEAARKPLRLPVQAVLRDGTERRYAGTVASGVLRRGASVHLSPSGRATAVVDIAGPDGPLGEAQAGTAVAIGIADEVDLSRGDVVADPVHPPHVVTEFSAHLVWFGEEPLAAGRSYLIQIGTRSTPGSVERIEHLVDVETGEERPATGLAQNDIGLCRIALVASVPVDLFAENPALGCLIVVDRTSFDTVGAGIVRQVHLGRHDVYGQAVTVSPGARAGQKGQRPAILWFTGLSGAGKSTVANLVEEGLHRHGCHTMLLDGDNVRQGLNRDLGFSEPDRRENIRRVAEVAKLMLEAGLIVLCSFISPFRIEREAARGLVGEGEFLEIFVDAPLDECIRRDPKGLYEKALAGKLADFTGIWSGYEPPEAPEIHLYTQGESAEDAADRVVTALRERGIV